MNPISIDSSISQGILFYVPAVLYSTTSLFKLDIYYTQSNPLFNWINCDTTKQLLYSQTTQEDPSGILFQYLSPTPLPAGFYTFNLSLITSSQPKEGSLVIGLINSQPYLVIGMPYSMFSTIPLS